MTETGEKQEIRQALHYPREAKQDTVDHLLRMQILLCLLIGSGIWLLGVFSPEQKCKLMDTYRSYMEEHRLSPKQELLRFAGNFSLENIPIPAMGGSGQKAKPENYSEESYQPDRDLVQPLEGYWVTSGYGWRNDPLADGRDFHTGIDLAAAQGTPIYAALPGIVLKAGCSKSYGNYILLSHGEEEFTLYAHMQYLFTRVGQKVSAGQQLGTVGATGAATGPHLHFELFHLDMGYDPAEALGL